MEVRIGELRLTEKYEHIDAVYATGISQSGMIREADFSKATEFAMSELIRLAKSVGANAIINVKFTTSYAVFSAGVNQAHVLAYGDAVKIIKT